MDYIETIEIRETTEPPGWGVDVDPSNNPTYPMRARHLSEPRGYAWERPVQQPLRIRVLHSNERPNVTAVFGTSTPPSGLSGLLRRFAFRYSESVNTHWVPLLLADRVNMVEGLLGDLGRGHLPNVFKEAGWGVQWRYDRARLLAKIGAVGVLAGAAATPFVMRRFRAPRKNAWLEEAMGSPQYSADIPVVVGDVDAPRVTPAVASSGARP